MECIGHRKEQLKDQVVTKKPENCLNDDAGQNRNVNVSLLHFVVLRFRYR
jgi:hypothetical protein